MSAASSKLPNTSLQLSLNSKVFIQYNHQNHFCIYLEKIDSGVCPLNNYRLRHLVPLTLEELLQLSEASKILCSTLEYNYNLSKKREYPDAKAKDQPDTPISVTGGSLIFDNDENERPPWKLQCCCIRKECERSLLVLLLHYFIVFLVVAASIGFLFLKQSENKGSIGVVAIISACLGYIIPSPRQ